MRDSCNEARIPTCRTPIRIPELYAALCPMKSANPAHKVEMPPQSRYMVIWLDAYFSYASARPSIFRES